MPQQLDDSWLGRSARGGADGVRVRTLPPNADWMGSAPDLVEITWTCGWRDRLCYGTPGPVTEARMDAFEKSIATLVEARGAARLMAVVSKGVVRTWHFYAADAGELLSHIEHAINAGRTGALGIRVSQDPAWATWETLSAAVAPPTVTHAPDAVSPERDAGEERPGAQALRDKDGPATRL